MASMPQDTKEQITMEDFRKLTEHLDATVPVYVQIQISDEEPYDEQPATSLRVDVAMHQEKKILRVVVG